MYVYSVQCVSVGWSFSWKSSSVVYIPVCIVKASNSEGPVAGELIATTYMYMY
jgi:hypothetical protein